jgi:hypothetical protein
MGTEKLETFQHLGEGSEFVEGSVGGIAIIYSRQVLNVEWFIVHPDLAEKTLEVEE